MYKISFQYVSIFFCLAYFANSNRELQSLSLKRIEQVGDGFVLKFYKALYKNHDFWQGHYQNKKGK